jgi:hypothetical protein
MRSTYFSIAFIITSTLLTLLFFQTIGTAQNQPDTVRAECFKSVPAQATATADISIWNDEILGGFSISLTFYDPHNPDIVCDSVSWSSTFWSHKPFLYDAIIDSTDKKLVMYAAFFPLAWPIGDNSLATLHLTTGPSWDRSIPMKIDSTGWDFFPSIELVDTVGIKTPHEFIPGCQGQPSVPSHLPWGLLLLALTVAGLLGYTILRRKGIVA